MTINRPTLLTAMLLIVAVGLLSTTFTGRKKHLIASETFMSKSGWGYNILVDGKVFIHQETVPGSPQASGFATREEARAVASLVGAKLGNGEIPTLNPNEISQIMKH